MSTAVYDSFRLMGLDYAELSLSANQNGYSASSILMTGMLLGGGTVSQTLALDGLNDGPGGAADFEVALLDGFWSTSDLVGLSFAGFIGASPNRAFQLDNIALEVVREAQVPEPGSLALATLALTGLGVARKRRALRAQV